MASLAKFDGLELPASADFHVHLRDATMMETVVPTIRKGGVNTVYVMPNLVPPLTSASDALAYKDRLQKLDPSINYLMTMYLHEKVSSSSLGVDSASRCFKALGVSINIQTYKHPLLAICSDRSTDSTDSGIVDYASCNQGCEGPGHCRCQVISGWCYHVSFLLISIPSYMVIDAAFPRKAHLELFTTTFGGM